MTIGTWIILNERDRGFALAAVMKVKLGLQVKISRPTRTNEQNRLLHALLGDLADQLPWPKDIGELHDVEWWKRRCTLGWLIDLRKENKAFDPEIVTDLDGEGEFGILLPHTSDLDIPQTASLIEWVFSFGALNGVVFKEKPKGDDAPPGEDEGYEAYR